MPRLPRISIPGITFHVVQRGNDRNAIFFSDDDFQTYLFLLKVASRRYETRVHAYALMTNHVHLLMTSSLANGISKTMQHTTGPYTRRVNKRLARTGPLWEGRYRSCAVDSDRYCLACYRYIELNPVRAGIVASPEDYRWSSHRQNIGRSTAFVVEPHVSYLSLGPSSADRAGHYRVIVRDRLPDRLVTEFRNGTRKETPVGGARFVEHVERAFGRRIGARARGRPKKGKKGV